MDLKEWGTPAIGVLTTIIGFIFGRQEYKRRASTNAVAEAEDSIGISYVQQLKLERDELATKYHALLEANQVQREELAAMKVRGENRDARMRQLETQVEKLTEALVVVRPELRPWLTSTGFGVVTDIPLDLPRTPKGPR
ncbi:MAG: hypothetical protein QM702_00190 [Rubrivivax sp.]